MNGKMTSHMGLAIGLVVLSLVLAYAGPVWADAAPPERPPGSSVDPGEAVTQVQMVSEEVLLEIIGKPMPAGEAGYLAADHMQGHVTATFVMRNQGQSEEAFEVWFPLGAPDGYSTVTTVSNFQAWVDGAPAQVSEALREGKWESMVPWATWPVTFPPAQDVILRVEYDVLPDGYSPYGTFPYVLETGAGWWGPIGTGTITFRLPYPVNETNTVLNPDVYGDAQTDWLAPNPADYTVSGTDVVWRFTELEPTAEDNVALTVLPPLVWERIVTAREAAVENPNSAEAQLGLARALNGALYFRYGLMPVGNSTALAEEVKAAYQRASELDPEEVELYVEYLDWLQLALEPGAPALPEDFLPTLERALELDPDHERLLELSEWLVQMEPYLVTPTPTTRATPEAVATATMAPSPTATASTTPPPTATPGPTAMPTATVTPVPSSTPAPSATTAPTATEVIKPTATSPPPAEPETGSRGICPGVAPLALLALGGIAWKRRRVTVPGGRHPQTRRDT
jgi:MYXO-CTERM domain-containing protein